VHEGRLVLKGGATFIRGCCIKQHAFVDVGRWSEKVGVGGIS